MFLLRSLSSLRPDSANSAVPVEDEQAIGSPAEEHRYQDIHFPQ